MIRELKLSNYRSFEDYTLSNLARVNLLVGPNNSGKTTVLEAVELLVSGGDPRVVFGAASRRDEVNSSYDRDSRTEYQLSHHFFGHRAGLGSELCVSSDRASALAPVSMAVGEPDDKSDLFGTQGELDQVLVIRVGFGDRETASVPIRTDGSTIFPWQRRPFRRNAAHLVPSQHISADSLSPRAMTGMWRNVVVNGKLKEVVRALRILEPNLTEVHFLPDRAHPSFALGLRGGSPVPLGSYGDGMRRLLALAVSLAETAGGYLLIDEIDTGLHWTVMDSMWKLVIEAAVASSVQVFATTHSFDCIRGLAGQLRAHPRLREHVTAQKIERRLPHSVDFPAEDLVTADEFDIEFR